MRYGNFITRTRTKLNFLNLINTLSSEAQTSAWRNKKKKSACFHYLSQSEEQRLKYWHNSYNFRISSLGRAPQRGAAYTEIKVPTVENTGLKGYSFKAWSRSEYSHTCPAYCHGFIVNFYPSWPFTCIFFQNFSRGFPVLAVGNTGSRVGPQNRTGHPAHRYWQLMQVPVFSASGI